MTSLLVAFDAPDAGPLPDTTTPIVLRVASDNLTQLLVYAHDAGTNASELIFDVNRTGGERFSALYAAASVDDAQSPVRTLTIQRDPEWPGDVTVRALATEFAGGLADTFYASRAFTDGGPGTIGSGSGDATDPTVTLIGPAAGRVLGRFTPLVVQYSDADAAPRLVIVHARFPAGLAEVVCTVRNDHAPVYSLGYAGSTAAPITNGYELAIVRASGWVEAPTIDVFVVDRGGNAEEGAPE